MLLVVVFERTKVLLPSTDNPLFSGSSSLLGKVCVSILLILYTEDEAL